MSERARRGVGARSKHRRSGPGARARRRMDVTDDVSIIENMGLPVKITMGEYTNLKITTPSDLIIAQQIMRTA